MYDTVIVRYGEIFLKSEPVRRHFEDLLAGNMEKRMRAAGLPYRIQRKRHRFYVKSQNPMGVVEALKTVFGIVSLSPAVCVRADLKEIVEACVSLAGENIKPKESFAVRAERSGRHPFSSRDVEASAGEKILESLDCRVDLDHPDKTIYVEIRDDDAYVYCDKVRGLGGMPYRSQGKLVALISTGIDSPVAAWMMMRRGCSIVVLHMGEEGAVDNVVRRLSFYAGAEIRVYNVPKEPVLERISQKAGKYTCVLCKRFMQRLAVKVMEKEGALGIITGESIGQVASQTLNNLKLISCVNAPIYRPLVALDKEDIIRMAKEIGTYDMVYGGRCKYVPDKPSTKAEEEVVKEIEAGLGVEGLLEDVADRFIFNK